MKKVLFLIQTEFHFIVSHLIYEQYFENFGYQMVFCYDTSKRLSSLDNQIVNECYVVINRNNDLADLRIRLITFIKKNNVTDVISFNSKDIIFIYLSYIKSKLNVKVCVAPDGMAEFASQKRPLFRSDFKLTVNHFKNIFKYKLWPNQIKPIRSGFARNGDLDVIYTFNQQRVNKDPSLCKLITYELSNTFLNKLTSFFLDFNQLNFKKHKIILLVSSGLPNRQLLEVSVANEIKKILPDFDLYVKTKFRTKSVDSFRKNNFKIIDSRVPAELIIASLKNAVVVSDYSTSLLYNNRTCRYFWYYPIAESQGVMNNVKNRTNPTNHIKVISSFHQLEHELLKSF